MRGGAGTIVPMLVLAWAAAASAERVELRTSDGFLLVGDLEAAAPEAPAAILLHMYRSDRRAFDPLVARLRTEGVTTLAIDQRTHGESVRQGETLRRVADVPRGGFGAVLRAGVHDVAAARALLEARGLGRGGLVLVGASYGCSVALLASAEPGVAGLVLLSPGTGYFGVDVVGAARAFPGPMLVVAAEDDGKAAARARALAEAHSGPERLIIHPTGGHGTRLFAPRPGVLDRIAEFVRSLPGG